MATSTTETDEFPRLADPFRRELFAHCYRMVGSVHNAEDLVQETYLRAWRSYHGFEGRSSLRTWLYRIATNVCLTALEDKGRRPLPTGLGAPGSTAGDPLVSNDEVLWLEPVPDSMISDPAEQAASRDTIRLAFIAALQHLPPRQRAVLILRDVLKWRAAEVAEALEISTAAVNSILQRAHAQMEKASLTAESITEPVADDQKELLEKYVDAFWQKDITAIVSLLTQDAIWEMPPFVGWYQGAENIGNLIDTQCPGGVNDMKMVATSANGQPAYGLYMKQPTASSRRSTCRCSPSRTAWSRTSVRSSTQRCSRPSGCRPSCEAEVVRSAPILSPLPLVESLGLLERAVGYTRGALLEVTPAMVHHPTPCSDWDLGLLLDHMVDSLAALTEAADLGYVALAIPDGPPSPVDAVEQLRTLACSLLGSWSAVASDEDVMVGDRPLASSLLACAGALEVTLHGWDVSQATGSCAPIPARLALDLLPWVDLFVTESTGPSDSHPSSTYRWAVRRHAC